MPTIDVKGNYNSSGGPFPCFTTIRTMADTLDAAHVSWRFYAPSIQGDWIGGAWSSFSSIANVRHGPDWQKIVTPPPTILTDIDAGKLAGVTWVAPDWQYSDHSGSGTTLGPSWVAAVVNKVGQSPFWDSTAIVVLWDDFGGWYDHLPPPQLDFKGLGIRVPCIIISPYVRRGYVIHTQYEFGSVLKLGRCNVRPGSRWARSRTGYLDARAASMLGAFDFTQKPRAFRQDSRPGLPGFLPAHEAVRKSTRQLGTQRCRISQWTRSPSQALDPNREQLRIAGRSHGSEASGSLLVSARIAARVGRGGAVS